VRGGSKSPQDQPATFARTPGQVKVPYTQSTPSTATQKGGRRTVKYVGTPERGPPCGDTLDTSRESGEHPPI